MKNKIYLYNIMNKPILLLSSSNLSQDIDSLYHLRGYASVLNLQDDVSDDQIKTYHQKNVIIANMNDEKQISKLRFIPQDAVYRVCVLRKWESTTEPWVQKAKADFAIKDTGFLKQCSNIAEVLTFIMHLNTFKKPDGNLMFYLRKLKSLLWCCFG